MSLLKLLRVHLLRGIGEEAQASIPAANQRILNGHELENLRVGRNVSRRHGTIRILRESDDCLLKPRSQHVRNGIPENASVSLQLLGEQSTLPVFLDLQRVHAMRSRHKLSSGELHEMHPDVAYDTARDHWDINPLSLVVLSL